MFDVRDVYWSRWEGDCEGCITMSEKQFHELLQALENLAQKFEEATEALQQNSQVSHKMVTLLEKIADNTTPGTKRLTK